MTLILSIPLQLTYNTDIMSHLKFQRKRIESLKSKFYTQQTINIEPRRSLGRILNDNIAKRRNSTQNSTDNSQNVGHIQKEIQEAKLLYKNKDTKGALEMFKKLHKKYPFDVQIPYFMGSCLLNEGNFSSALINFRICLAQENNFTQNVYIYMAICYKAEGKLKQAVQILENAIRKYPLFAEGYIYKGKIHMKLHQYQQAIACFRKILKTESSQKDVIQLLIADCLSHLKKYEEAIEIYSYLILKDNKQTVAKAINKKIQLLIQLKNPVKASYEISLAIKKGIDFPDLLFFKGQCDYLSGNYNEAMTSCELSLNSGISKKKVIEILRIMLQIYMRQKDFFGAEHLISRTKFMGIDSKQFDIYCKMVEGINDLIKKRLNESEQKLSFVFEACEKQASSHFKFISEAISPYYAYCLFSQQKFKGALDVYTKNNNQILKIDENLNEYNRLICQGVIKHQLKQFHNAEQIFSKTSKLISNKVEPIFLKCINIITENKKLLIQNRNNSKVFEKLQRQFFKTQKILPQSSLFLFYQSLVYLFNGQNACQLINKAIAQSEDEVSEYFFIQALAFSLAGQNEKGIESLNKAIELDPTIPQFFKQRSKYNYILSRFDESVTDIVKVLEESNDDQAKLLLTFYYYMTDEYALSLQLLNQVGDQNTDQKFKQFVLALNFRIGQWSKCGIVGQILQSIVRKQKMSKDLVMKMGTKIKQRQCYSQFTIYHYHLLMAAAYFYSNQIDMCLQHLFHALQQIQVNTEADQQYANISQQMLNQIKFNITLANLVKQSKIQECKFQQTCKYVHMFAMETSDGQFITILKQLVGAIKNAQSKGQGQKQKITKINLYSNVHKISDNFPDVNIQLSKNKQITTKFIMSYPHKLKFNIAPEFDDSFLFNFDIQKVQNKLCPPWFKLYQGKISFTEKIRNQSVFLSETERSVTPLIIEHIPERKDIRERIKLDESIERKLDKIMKAKQKRRKSGDC